MHRIELRFLIASLAVVLCFGSTASGRNSGEITERAQPFSAAAPAYCEAVHNIGKIALTINNHGSIGNGYIKGSRNDCFTGRQLPSCEYPKGSNNEYLFAGLLWIGAILGRDTLVSTAADGWAGTTEEFAPESPPLGNLKFRSTLDPSKAAFNGAVSEQDYIAVYYDTCVSCGGSDPIDARPHRPLNIEVIQRSFSWSYSYAEDIVLFDYAIKNIGTQRLRKVYMGYYVDADVGGRGAPLGGSADDLCGFLDTIKAQYGNTDLCPALDTVNLAFILDNNGDFNELSPPSAPVPHVTALRVVRTPSDSLNVSFNWWVSNGNAQLDFGPQGKATFRDLGHGGTGTPAGDRNKYALLSNGEFDYDQAFTADISPLDPIWTYPPPEISGPVSKGFDTRYLLSFGPFDIDPGQTLPLSLSYMAGENIHYKADNYTENLDNSYKPQEFYENLDFSDLGLNATWASWIYDNPGFDTDGDSVFGKFRVCPLDSVFLDSFFVIDTSASPDTGYYVDNYDYTRLDTTWYEGDGVPDFKGASPPPAPSKRVEPFFGQIIIRFNGAVTENAIDVFAKTAGGSGLDFEGYRIYYGRDDRSSSYSLVASFDVEDYNRYDYDAIVGNYVLKANPFTLAQLRTLYAPDSSSDSTWHPLDYPRNNPFRFNHGGVDSTVYFVAQDFNQSDLSNPNGIHKTYPNAPKPPKNYLIIDSIPNNERDLYLTKDNLFKFYEYEFTLKNLQSSVPYWINVTAFDYGSPKSGLPPLETSITLSPANTYAFGVNNASDSSGKVFIYPNPYRGDGAYLDDYYERQNTSSDAVVTDRLRIINFANLPSRCIIRIFSLDGDMVREINHNIDISDPLHNHDTWDLISRNTQKVASGLYYWSVENLETGDMQLGKLVIIL